MAFSSCLCHPLTIKIDCLEQPMGTWRNDDVGQRSTSALRSRKIETFGQQVAGIGTDLPREWSFIGGSSVIMRPQIATFFHQHKSFRVHASYMFVFLGTIASDDAFLTTFPALSGPQLASTMFTLGTAAVLPFYTLMVFAPKAELTKKSMESSIPYVVLGVLYSYLLFLSWTPDTLPLMFASKYWLPELPGMAKMFSGEITLASAWIHLLAVDLFAARQVFQDGLRNEIETRHSVSLCLLFCPIGILTHVITKALTKSSLSTTRRTR